MSYFKLYTRMFWWPQYQAHKKRGMIEPRQIDELFMTFPPDGRGISQPHFPVKSALDYAQAMKDLLKRYPDLRETLGRPDDRIHKFVFRLQHWLNKGYTYKVAFDKTEQEMAENLHVVKQYSGMQSVINSSTSIRSFYEHYEATAEYEGKNKVKRLEENLPKFKRAKESENIFADMEYLNSWENLNVNLKNNFSTHKDTKFHEEKESEEDEDEDLAELENLGEDEPVKNKDSQKIEDLNKMKMEGKLTGVKGKEVIDSDDEEKSNIESFIKKAKRLVKINHEKVNNYDGLNGLYKSLERFKTFNDMEILPSMQNDIVKKLVSLGVSLDSKKEINLSKVKSESLRTSLENNPLIKLLFTKSFENYEIELTPVEENTGPAPEEGEIYPPTIIYQSEDPFKQIYGRLPLNQYEPHEDRVERLKRLWKVSHTEEKDVNKQLELQELAVEAMRKVRIRTDQILVANKQKPLFPPNEELNKKDLMLTYNFDIDKIIRFLNLPAERKLNERETIELIEIKSIIDRHTIYEALEPFTMYDGQRSDMARFNDSTEKFYVDFEVFPDDEPISGNLNTDKADQGGDTSENDDFHEEEKIHEKNAKSDDDSDVIFDSNSDIDYNYNEVITFQKLTDKVDFDDSRHYDDVENLERGFMSIVHSTKEYSKLLAPPPLKKVLTEDEKEIRKLKKEIRAEKKKEISNKINNKVLFQKVTNKFDQKVAEREYLKNLKSSKKDLEKDVEFADDFDEDKNDSYGKSNKYRNDDESDIEVFKKRNSSDFNELDGHLDSFEDGSDFKFSDRSQDKGSGSFSKKPRR